MNTLSLLQLGILYSLISVFSWGIGDFFSALVSRKISSVSSVFWVNLIGCLVLVSYLIVSHTPIQLNSLAICFGVLAGLFFALGINTFYQGLKIGKVSLVSPISASYSVILVLTGSLLFKESLTLVQIIAITAIILGTILAATNLGELFVNHQQPLWSDPGIPFALFTILFWGLAFISLNQAIIRVGWAASSIILYPIMVVVTAVFSLITRQSLAISQNLSLWLTILIAGILGMGGFLGYSLGIATINMASIIGPVSAAYPAITILLSFFFFKERLAPNQIIGILAIIGGTVILSR